MTEYELDTDLRVRALTLSANVEESREDVRLRAELYYRFLTGAVETRPTRVDEYGEEVAVEQGNSPSDRIRRIVTEELDKRSDESRPIKLIMSTNPGKVDEAARAMNEARARFKPDKNKAAVYAQIMAIVHEAGVFVDPVLLARDLASVILNAEVRPA